jgi:hypothetical protein
MSEVIIAEMTPRQSRTEGGEASTRRDLLLLLALFVSFRLMAIIFFKPGGEVYVGGHDFQYYMSLAELSLEGKWPYLDYWMEYPPLFPLALIGLYRLSLLLPSWPVPSLWFQLAISAFLLIWESGNLILVHALARRLYGPALGVRAAWIYAGLFLPLYTLTNWFDAFSLFFLLLALYLAVRGRAFLAGMAVGVGFLVKLIPAVAAPAVLLAWRTWRERAAFVVAGAVVVVVVVAPLYIANSVMVVASFRSMVERSSWLTPWALLEGYFGVGFTPVLAARFSPENADWQMHPATLPWLWINVSLLLAGAILFTRRLDWRQPSALVASTALALNLLLIFSKGWSPQFAIYPLAFLAILLPNGWGLAYAVLLTFNTFLEWPIAGLYFQQQQWLMWAIVAMRTGLLALLCLEYLHLLYPGWQRHWYPVRNAAALPALALLLAAGAWGGSTLVGYYVTGSDWYKVAIYAKALSLPEQGLVASTGKAFYGLKAYFPDDRFFAPREDVWSDDKALVASLSELAKGRSQVWVVLDHSQGDRGREGLVLDWFDRWGSRASERWFDAYQVLAYVPYAADSGTARRSLGLDFDGQLALDGWQTRSTNLTPGEPCRLELYWRATSVPKADYKVFVHLLATDGKIASQADTPLRGPAGMATKWRPGEVVRETYDLVLPPTLAPGAYTIALGLYEPQSGKRLPVVAGGTGDSVTLTGWVAASGNKPPTRP